MNAEEKKHRIEQLKRLIQQATTAKGYLERDLPMMPLEEHMHPASLKIGDFVIVDLQLCPSDYEPRSD
jgi:hypothetical protein